MARTFKALSALLSYPSEALQQAASEIYHAIRSEGLVDPDARRAIEPLLAEFEKADLLDLQERYVDLFDKTRRLSLHLFEHVHGESRDRGQAMVDLLALYEKEDMALTANELPDYLPVFLEYMSTRPLSDARELLDNIVPILSEIADRLASRNSPYAAVFGALLSIAGQASPALGGGEAVDTMQEDFAALDAEWEETAVVFGPGEALDGCSVDRLRTQLRASQRDVRRTMA
jgi:nitrate reductase delta subunit